MDDKTKAEIEFLIEHPHLDKLITHIRQHQYLPPTEVTTFPPNEEQE